MEKVKISIIDDNKVIRDNIAKFLSFHEEFELGVVRESATMFLDSLIISAPNQTHISIA